MTTKDLVKEIELAEDLKVNLDAIEGKKTKRSRTKTAVSQEVKSPADAERSANVGDLDQMKQKLENLDKAEVKLEIPDPVKHKYISFVKSGVRIAAGLALILVPLETWANVAGVLLIIAEILGIAEEMV